MASAEMARPPRTGASLTSPLSHGPNAHPSTGPPSRHRGRRRSVLVLSVSHGNHGSPFRNRPHHPGRCRRADRVGEPLPIVPLMQRVQGIPSTRCRPTHRQGNATLSSASSALAAPLPLERGWHERRRHYTNRSRDRRGPPNESSGHRRGPLALDRSRMASSRGGPILSGATPGPTVGLALARPAGTPSPAREGGRQVRSGAPAARCTPARRGRR